MKPRDLNPMHQVFWYGSFIFFVLFDRKLLKSSLTFTKNMQITERYSGMNFNV